MVCSLAGEKYRFLLQKAREEYMWTHQHCVNVSSNSDKNCQKISILKKNHDVTIMTSSALVMSLGT